MGFKNLCLSIGSCGPGRHSFLLHLSSPTWLNTLVSTFTGTSHLVACLFVFLMVSVAVQKLFSLMWSDLFILFFCFPCWRRYIQKKLLRAMSKSLLPIFSARIFMVLDLTLKSVIYFEFIPLYGIRKWSSFIFLRVSVKFSQHHLLKRLSLPHCMFLPPLS